MAYSIQIGETGFHQLASNAGYADFGSWIEGLDHEKYPDLVHLYEHGWNDEAADIQKELAAALKSDSPDDESTKKTADGFLEILQGASGVITVTNGIG